MSDLHAALGGMVTVLGVGMTVAARGWPTGRRRRGEAVSEELMTELLGPPTPYMTSFEHAPGPIRTGLGYCPPCDRVTGGSLNKDGWLCGECLTPSGGVA